MAGRLSGLKWIRSLSNTSQSLVFVALLGSANPAAANLVRAYTVAENAIELVCKTGTLSGEVATLSGVVVKSGNLPSTIVVEGLELTQIATSVVSKPALKVVDEAGTVLWQSTDAASSIPYQLAHYSHSSFQAPVIAIARAAEQGGSGNDGDCQVCAQRGSSVRTLYEQICYRVTNRVLAKQALNKICQNISSDVVLQAIGAVLIDWDASELSAFFEDITATNSSLQHITNQVGELTVGMVRAWERLYVLLPQNLRYFASDLPHLKFLSHPDVQDALAWLRTPSHGKMNIFNENSNLLPGEVISLNYYTHRGDQINNYYRTGLGSIEAHYQFSDEHVAVYSSFLNSALAKLPGYDIPVGSALYRGTSDYETNFLLNLSRGADYIPPFYYSSSKNVAVAVARTSAMPSPGGLVITIQPGGFKGVDISGFSRYNEQEVLYKINSKFERGDLIPAEYSDNSIYPEIILTPKL